MTAIDPATVHRFSVVVDIDQAGQTDLGAFTKCAGLKAVYTETLLAEGGENGFVHRLLGRLTYEKITLTRALGAGSGAVAAWFFSFRDEPRPTTAEIAALAPAGTPIAAWRLAGVVPLEWQGPSFDAAGSVIATETLVLGHDGFVTETVAPGTPRGAAGAAGLAAGLSFSMTGSLG